MIAYFEGWEGNIGRYSTITWVRPWLLQGPLDVLPRDSSLGTPERGNWLCLNKPVVVCHVSSFLVVVGNGGRGGALASTVSDTLKPRNCPVPRAGLAQSLGYTGKPKLSESND